MSAPSLLLAFDGSPAAVAAVRAAASLFPGAVAIVADVKREPATLGQAAALARAAVPDAVIAGGLAALDRAAEEEARAIVASGAAIASAARLRAETAIVDAAGTPWHAIRRLARERDATIVVCGSRGLGPFSRAAIGSTSSGLLHHAERPVLVVPDGGGGLTGPVIVGYDGSKASAAAVSLAVEWFPSRRRIVVNVWESLVRHSPGGRSLVSAPLESARSMTAEMDACFEAIAADIAEQGAGIARGDDGLVIARAVQSAGSPWHGVLAAARAAGAALIVVGTRGRGAIASGPRLGVLRARAQRRHPGPRRSRPCGHPRTRTSSRTGCPASARRLASAATAREGAHHDHPSLPHLNGRAPRPHPGPRCHAARALPLRAGR